LHSQCLSMVIREQKFSSLSEAGCNHYSGSRDLKTK
jgi:hypothetical protein